MSFPLIRSLDFVAAGIAKANSTAYWNGLVVSVMCIATLIFPLLLSILLLHGTPRNQMLAFGVLTLPPALMFVRWRESSIRAMAQSFPSPGNNRASNILLLSFLTIGIGSIFGARHSPLAAISAFTVLSCLPWPTWAGFKSAP